MMWPFSKKHEEITNPELKRLLGRPLRIGADARSLKEKLKTNRSVHRRGSGDVYWDSVVRVVEEHYGIKANEI